MRIAVLLLVAQLAGCTLALPVIGGASASSSNASARAQHKPETASVGGRVAVGLVVGVIVDLIILSVWADKAFEHQPEG